MESLQTTVTNLTGAVNALLEQVSSMERRVSTLDSLRSRLALIEAGRGENVAPVAEVQPRAPTSEADLKDISRLPDSVKELQAFDGNPVQYVSWVHSVESILSDFKVVKNKPIYRAILQHIRQKVRGAADAALISYNILTPTGLPLRSVYHSITLISAIFAHWSINSTNYARRIHGLTNSTHP